MTLEGLHDLLDRFGGDRATWPPGARGGAERLLAASAEAQEALAAQQAVDSWFAATSENGVHMGLAARAVRAPQLRPPSRLARWGGGAAIAAAALLALGLGAATGATHATAEEPAQALAQALAGSGESFDAG